MKSATGGLQSKKTDSIRQSASNLNGVEPVRWHGKGAIDASATGKKMANRKAILIGDQMRQDKSQMAVQRFKDYKNLKKEMEGIVLEGARTTRVEAPTAHSKLTLKAGEQLDVIGAGGSKIAVRKDRDVYLLMRALIGEEEENAEERYINDAKEMCEKENSNAGVFRNLRLDCAVTGWSDKHAQFDIPGKEPLKIPVIESKYLDTKRESDGRYIYFDPLDLKELVVDEKNEQIAQERVAKAIEVFESIILHNQKQMEDFSYESIITDFQAYMHSGSCEVVVIDPSTEPEDDEAYSKEMAAIQKAIEHLKGISRSPSQASPSK